MTKAVTALMHTHSFDDLYAFSSINMIEPLKKDPEL